MLEAIATALLYAVIRVRLLAKANSTPDARNSDHIIMSILMVQQANSDSDPDSMCT
jgi:hypothetical protein